MPAVVNSFACLRNARTKKCNFFLRLSLVDTTYGVYYDWGLGGGLALLQEGADGVYHPGKV